MFDLFQFGDYARQMSQWKVIPESSVEGQASCSDARYLCFHRSLDNTSKEQRLTKRLAQMFTKHLPL